MGVLAFGPGARAWANALGETAVGLILTDVSGASSALLAAIDARREGREVVAGIVVEDPRAALPAAVGAGVILGHPTRDAQRQGFMQLAAGQLQIGGRSQAEAMTEDPRNVQTLREFIRLVDVLVVRSWIERERVRAFLGFLPRRVVRALPAPQPIVAPGEERDRIVVWAPASPVAETALYAWTLVDLKTPVTIVCAEGKIEGLGCRIVRPKDADEELRHAAVVIATDTVAPHAAVALAAAGHAVVAAPSTGAHEYVDGLITFEPWNFYAITSAVQRALARRPLRVRTEALGPLPAIEPDALPAGGPLVSLIVRTVDRPRFLERALASISRQIYGDVEAVVVNDGGPPVDAIVAQFPFARLVVNPVSLGPAGAANAGLAEARGEYVGLLDDDDLLFADHVARLVQAAQVSGSAVVHADTINCYLELSPLSDYAVYGYRVLFATATHLDELYVQDRVAPMAVLARRDLLARLGGFDAEIGHAEDWELWIRLAKEADFVHVPVVTAVYTTRSDDTNAVRRDAAKFAGAFEKIIERHPVSDRPEIDRTREAIVAARRTDDPPPRFPEPAIRFEPPRPLP